MTQPPGPVSNQSIESPIQGLLPVIPTPFINGGFDENSLLRFFDHFLPWLDGYTLLGSTGEAPSLATSERMKIAEFAMAATPAGKIVVVGVSHTSVEDSIALAQHAESIGAHGVLCSAPYYFTNSDTGARRFLQALDDALQIELVLYDNPIATGFHMPAETVCAWAAQLKNLHTVKLTDHDLSKIASWHDAGLKVLAGDDPIAFRFLADGADGAMMIAPSIVPEAFSRVWKLVRDGDLESAYALFSARILPLIHVFGIGDEIVTSKAVLRAIGVFTSAEVLPPLVQASPRRSALVEMGYRVAIGREEARRTGQVQAKVD
jgi:4-hydroxy-tetrahydrodipicolinate synthase